MPVASGMDLLDVLAPLLRVRPVLDDICRFGGAWQSVHSPAGRGWAQFHIVTRGACRLERPDAGEIQLGAGDILLLPHGDSHIVRSQSGGTAGKFSTEYRNAIRSRRTVEAEPDTELLCGRLLFEASDENALVAALPDFIIIHTRGEPLMARFRNLLTDIRDELDAARPGSNQIASDFASALFVMMLRFHLEQEPEQGSMLSLLQDRITSKVLIAVLKEPEKDWTLDEMAGVGVTSRATLVRAFRKACGVAPMTWLADLRLDLARQCLAGTDDPISKVAASVGYQSEGALSKAFLRKFGIRPGAVRTR